MEQRGSQQSQLDSDDAEEQAVRSERERHRITDEQEHDERREHQWRHVGYEECRHFASSALRAITSSIGSSCFSDGSGMRPFRKATRLISSDTPCSVSRKKPAGTSARASQRIRPPALPDTSLLFQAFMKIGHDSHTMYPAIGKRKHSVQTMSIQACVRRDRRPAITSIRICSLCNSV